MSVSICTDQETDRLMSLRASSQVPLPPEVCLADPRAAPGYFAWMLPLELLGYADHPLVAALRSSRRSSMMASALSRADHLDRISHFSAWNGREIVRIEDLASSIGPQGGDRCYNGRGPSPSHRSPDPGGASRPQGTQGDHPAITMTSPRTRNARTAPERQGREGRQATNRPSVGHGAPARTTPAALPTDAERRLTRPPRTHLSCE